MYRLLNLGEKSNEINQGLTFSFSNDLLLIFILRFQRFRSRRSPLKEKELVNWSNQFKVKPFSINLYRALSPILTNWTTSPFFVPSWNFFYIYIYNKKIFYYYFWMHIYNKKINVKPQKKPIWRSWKLVIRLSFFIWFIWSISNWAWKNGCKNY